MSTEPLTPSHVGELHQDAMLLVLDKPAGLPVHPSSRYVHGTVVNRLRQMYGPNFAAPVHRLDRETSGVLLCAKHTVVARELSMAFAARLIRKVYLAITHGHAATDSLQVDAPLAVGGPRIRIGMRVDRALGKPAQTTFVVQRRLSHKGAPFTLWEAYPHTGRRHQVRAHLLHAGYPVLGDKIYGLDDVLYEDFAQGTLSAAQRAKLILPRHALHAWKLHLDHPCTRAPTTYCSPLAADLALFARCG